MEKIQEEIQDMTAQEWFEKGSMFTLDFLEPAERETIFKIMDMYALGKTRVASKALSAENERLRACLGRFPGFNVMGIEPEKITSWIQELDELICK